MLTARRVMAAGPQLSPSARDGPEAPALAISANTAEMQPPPEGGGEPATGRCAAAWSGTAHFRRLTPPSFAARIPLQGAEAFHPIRYPAESRGWLPGRANHGRSRNGFAVSQNLKHALYRQRLHTAAVALHRACAEQGVVDRLLGGFDDRFE